MTTEAPPIDLSSIFRLDGRVAIVTGASGGLGERFARVLHAAGATVVVAARRADRLDALVDELGDRALAITCDVSDDAATQALVDRTLEAYGTIDVLLNNAGLGGPVPAEQMEIADFRAQVDVNLVGLFALSQQAGRHMLSVGSGSIINIASILGMVAASPIKQAAYCATKGPS